MPKTATKSDAYQNLITVHYHGIGKIIFEPKDYTNGDGFIYFKPETPICVPHDELEPGMTRLDILEQLGRDPSGEYFLKISHSTSVNVPNEAEIAHYSMSDLIEY